MPRAARASTAALAAPSDVFFDRPRVRRSAPNACALITASVPQIGGGPGDGERLAFRNADRRGIFGLFGSGFDDPAIAAAWWIAPAAVTDVEPDGARGRGSEGAETDPESSSEFL